MAGSGLRCQIEPFGQSVCHEGPCWRLAQHDHDPVALSQSDADEFEIFGRARFGELTPA